MNADSNHFTSVATIASDGSYTARYTNVGPAWVNEGFIEGTQQIKDGYLIDTMTKHSNTNAVLPVILRARIIQFDDHQLVLQWEKMGTNQAILHKLGDH
jgi:hypothetical protein